MDPHTNRSEAEIDSRIWALQRPGQRVMFSQIAQTLPDCTWQRLFNALGRLSKRNQVTLVAHRWDYEIIFLSNRPTEHGPTGSSRALDRCSPDEIAHK